MNEQKKKKRKSNNFIRTLNILIVLSFIVVVIFTSRIIIVGRVGDNDLQELVETRKIVNNVLPAKRGSIYDSKGNLLAQTLPTYNLIAILSESQSDDLDEKDRKRHVTNPEAVARGVAPIIGMPEGEMLGLLKEDRFQVEFAPHGNGLTQVQKDAIEALDLEGLVFTSIDSRNYPQSRFASHIIGYASYNQETRHLEGAMGIEARLESYLEGVDGQEQYSENMNGLKIDVIKELYVEPQDGADVTLTLDTTIQRLLEDVMIEVESTTELDWASVIIANPKTGAILGAAQTPSFDPNTKDIVDFNNRIAQVDFEVGSIMKPITFASAIDVGRYDGHKGIATGSVQVGDTPISDWNRVGWGIQEKDRGLCLSANTITADVVRNDLTAEEQKEYLKRFGFGKATGIEIAEEAKGHLVLETEIERVTTGFGQGSTASVVQILQAYNALANEGKMMQLHLVDNVKNPQTGEYLYKSEPKMISQPVSKETADHVKELLIETATDPNCASGDAYKMDTATFAGKTGTAEVVDPETGKYRSGVYNYTYAGFAPAEDPQFVILSTVYLPFPNTNETTKKIINSLTDEINRYLSNENPNSPGNTIDIGLNADTIRHIDSFPSFLNVSVEEFQNYAQGINARKFDILGNGTTIIEQSVEPYTSYMNTERIIVRTDSAEIAYPQFAGWSRKDIERFAEVADVSVYFEGTGYAVGQSVPEGTIINGENNSITIQLVV